MRLRALPTEENQITSNKGQNYSSKGQVYISFHGSFPPLKNEVKNNYNNAANYCSKEIGVHYIPFNHFSASSTNLSESAKNTTAISSERPTENKRLIILSGRINNGEIIPAENQAAEILPTISETLFSCLEENLIIATERNMKHGKCQGRMNKIGAPGEERLRC